MGNLEKSRNTCAAASFQPTIPQRRSEIIVGQVLSSCKIFCREGLIIEDSSCLNKTFPVPVSSASAKDISSHH